MRRARAGLDEPDESVCAGPDRPCVSTLLESPLIPARNARPAREASSFGLLEDIYQPRESAAAHRTGLQSCKWPGSVDVKKRDNAAADSQSDSAMQQSPVRAARCTAYICNGGRECNSQMFISPHRFCLRERATGNSFHEFGIGAGTLDRQAPRDYVFTPYCTTCLLPSSPPPSPPPPALSLCCGRRLSRPRLHVCRSCDRATIDESGTQPWHTCAARPCPAFGIASKRVGGAACRR